MEGSDVLCPICNKQFLSFLPLGISKKRADSYIPKCCPSCGSLERHRLFWLYFTHEKYLSTSKIKLLHVAPEGMFYDFFSKNNHVEYHPIDKHIQGYSYPSETKHMDITNLHYENEFFDMIICNHVLEHVIEDHTAMTEFYRVLKPGGVAFLSVPVYTDREQTYEDAAIKDPIEREKIFGQWDHVRIYGIDYKKRLETAGFKVELNNYFDNFTQEEIYYYGLDKETIYISRK
jgi:SAM-dependent methyltransferase